jgi:4-hydroxy-tetrahydrodipicolinate synthase
MAYSRAVVAAAPTLDVFPSSEAVLFEAKKDGFAGCISASTNITCADSQIAWSHQGEPQGKEAVARATAQRGILGKQALVASVKATLSVLYGDPQWARTCPPLLPRSARQTEALAAELRAAGLPLPEPAVA